MTPIRVLITLLTESRWFLPAEAPNPIPEAVNPTTPRNLHPYTRHATQKCCTPQVRKSQNDTRFGARELFAETS